MTAILKNVYTTSGITLCTIICIDRNHQEAQSEQSIKHRKNIIYTTKNLSLTSHLLHSYSISLMVVFRYKCLFRITFFITWQTESHWFWLFVEVFTSDEHSSSRYLSSVSGDSISHLCCLYGHYLPRRVLVCLWLVKQRMIASVRTAFFQLLKTNMII